jgi:hypothetical protein
MNTGVLATLFLLWILPCFGQQASEVNKAESTGKDVDSIALKVPKAATAPLPTAQSYSFRTLDSTGNLGPNGRIIALLDVSVITVARPDEPYVNFRGQRQEVELFFNSGQCVPNTPKENLYSPLPCAKTMDAGLNELGQKDVFMPVRSFWASHSYQSLTGDVRSGYVAGSTVPMDQQVHHPAFTAPGVGWQAIPRSVRSGLSSIPAAVFTIGPTIRARSLSIRLCDIHSSEAER